MTNPSLNDILSALTTPSHSEIVYNFGKNLIDFYLLLSYHRTTLDFPGLDPNSDAFSDAVSTLSNNFIDRLNTAVCAHSPTDHSARVWTALTTFITQAHALWADTLTTHPNAATHYPPLTHLFPQPLPGKAGGEHV